MREGAWVGRAPAGSGSGRHVEEGTWCCSNDDACRSAAPPIAPLPSRRVAASRGQYRWCGGGGSLHRPAAGAAITSMRGGCRRLVWLEAYAAPPKPYCRSSAWRLGRAAVVVADGIWRRRRRLALPSGRNSDPAALAGGGAPTAARPWLRIHLTPFLLNGYPCLLCPCVVCFKFLQPKVIEGKKIDCALADPHLPRLLGGAPQLFTTNLVFVLRLFRACGLFSLFLARPAAAMSLRRGQHDAATAEAVSDARARYADPSSNWRSLSESTNFEWNKFLTSHVCEPPGARRNALPARGQR